MKRKLTVGSLFAGIGGFDLGFERAGMKTIYQVERDAECRRVLAHRFPRARRFNDVVKIGRLPAVDVLCGGFPCQDLSVAGKRAGLAGERSGLWFDFLRIIERDQPRVVVIENVPGLLSSNKGADFAVVIGGLVECGYGVAWRILDAQHFGVPQRRRRVFIVGSLGTGGAAQILFEREGLRGDPPARGKARARIAPAIDGKPFADRGANEGRLVIPLQEVDARQGNQNGCGIGIGDGGDVMYTLQAQHEHGVAHTLSGEGHDATEDGPGRGTPLVVAGCFTGYNGGPDFRDGPAGQLIPFDPTQITSSENRCCPRPGDPCHPLAAAAHAPAIAFGRKDGDIKTDLELSPTLRALPHRDSHANGGGQVAISFGWNKSDAQTMRVDFETTDALQSAPCSQPAIAFQERGRAGGRNFEAQNDLAYSLNNPGEGGRAQERNIAGEFGVRRLTPRECERLQGFPDDWTAHDAEGVSISDSGRYRMLGNAVAVPCAEWIGRRIIDQWE